MEALLEGRSGGDEWAFAGCAGCWPGLALAAADMDNGTLGGSFRADREIFFGDALKRLLSERGRC